MSPAPPISRPRRITFTIALAAMLLVAVITLEELLAPALGLDSAVYTFHNEARCIEVVEHDDVGWVWRKNACSQNSLGMWDRDTGPVSREPPNGVTRLVVIGDSVAAGIGVPINHTFENLTEDALRAAAKTPIESFNLASPGQNASQWKPTFDHFNLNAHIAIVAVCPNDSDGNLVLRVENSIYLPTPTPQAATYQFSPLASLLFPLTAYRHMLTLNVAAREYKDGPITAKALANAIAFPRQFADKGMRVLVLLLPYFRKPDVGVDMISRCHDFYAKLRTAYARNSIPLLDLEPSCLLDNTAFQRPDDLTDTTHPSADGHRYIANRLLERLNELAYITPRNTAPISP